ncbi:MAG: hypothetical protein ACON31_02155 [Candidatus Puniceispirillaceae bacterium]
MTRIAAVLFVCLSLSGLPAAAHQCILKDSSADAIQAYNVCKADLADGTANHDASSGQSGEMSRLQAENDALRAQLADIKRRLLGLLADL